VSGPYRGGRDDNRRRDGGSRGSGGYPQQQGYPGQDYPGQDYQGQGYGEPPYSEQDYPQQDYPQQDYRQQERGGRGGWDAAAPVYGDPYDRGYGRPSVGAGQGGAGQADPRQGRPPAQTGNYRPGWDDQPAGYGTGPHREQAGGGYSRSGGYPQPGSGGYPQQPGGGGYPQPGGGGYPQQVGGGSFREDSARGGPVPTGPQRGTGPSPWAGRDPQERRDGRPRWEDHDDFVPGFDETDGQRDYVRDDRRPARGQAPGAGRDERYGDDYRDGRYDDGSYGDSQYDNGQYDEGRYGDDYADRGGRGGRGGRGDGPGERPGKRKRGPIRRIAPWVAVLVIIVPLVFGGLYAYHFIQNKEHPADYVGAGVGPAVLVQVKSGDTATSLAPALLADGVIKSTRAFVLAAEHSSSTAGLEAGFFSMNRQMQASLAYAYLLDPKHRVQGTVTIPEGKRLSQILALLVKAHPKITMADYQAVLKKPAQLGLPAYAAGKPEGYLFPSTYIIQPNDTALTVLQAMVAQYNRHTGVFNLPKTAPAVGMTPAKIIIVASLIQAESGRNQDMGKIAEVLYNRLNQGMPLQFDSTVLYGLGKYGTTATIAETQKPGPYNSYANKGLTPGPIDSPGDLAIQAALHPEHGNLLYFRGCPNKVTLFSSITVPALSLCPAH
jgi:UPF0755 protein